MISFELSNTISQYITSEISLEELENWLVPRLPAILRSPETEDAGIVAEIELGLAEISNRYWTEEEFRIMLNELLMEHTTEFVSLIREPEPATSTGTSTSYYTEIEPSKPLEWVVQP